MAMLKSGELAGWAEERDSKNHKLRDESLIIALRKNPAPVDRKWKEMQLEEY